MKERYHQLTLEQRYKLEAYLRVGKNQTECALMLGVHKSTISRELKRNTPQRGLGANCCRCFFAEENIFPAFDEAHSH